MNIESELVAWYKRYKRELPWRNTKNPYEIWISEIILQQTRVDHAISYYFAFLENFPTVSKLASASEQEVLKIWQGLGYYSRARNLHTSAKYVENELKGIIPQSYQELLNLKGIGIYTAAAIASFAYNEKVAVVDGNVFRVLSRLYGDSTPINSTKGKRIFIELASKLIEKQEPAIFNQAIMEFGAIQCTVKKPDCPNCVIKEYCKAFKQNNIEKYPVKDKLQKKKNRFLSYLFVDNAGFTYLKKRENKDIWQGLYEFPLIESHIGLDLLNLMKTADWQNYFRSSYFRIENISGNIVHQLTHQQLEIVFVTIVFEKQNSADNTIFNDFIKIPFEKLKEYPVPKPIENYIKQMNL